MASDWWLRRALESDGPGVAVTFRASFRLLDFLPTLHTPEQDLAFFSGVIAAQRVTLADRDGEILGLMSETDTWVNHLYVHPIHLRRGIGSALIRSAQGRQDFLQLWCFRKNGRGRRFYEAHGFKAARFTDRSGNEEREPDILYEWRRTANGLE